MKKPFNNMKTIQTLLQEYVDEIVKNTIDDLKCPPKYIVSIGDDKLILTITHNDVSFSEVIFPEEDMSFGISLLLTRVDALYARTM